MISACFIHNVSYVGRLLVNCTGKPTEILSKLNKFAGYALDQEIDLYEVCIELHFYQLLFHFAGNLLISSTFYMSI